MPVFTIHLDRKNPDKSAALERIELVPERFNKAAFLFGPFWLLVTRLWMPLLIWLVVAIALVALVIFARLPGTAVFWLYLASSLLFGLEGNNWLRRKLEIRGFGCVDIASGPDSETAVRRFLTRHEPGPANTSRAPDNNAHAERRVAPATRQIGGLFPDGDAL